MDRFMRLFIDPRINPIFVAATERRGFRPRDVVKIVERRQQKVAENLTSVRRVGTNLNLSLQFTSNFRVAANDFRLIS